MKKYLSFDIGGTNLKYAIIDHSGNIIEKIVSQLIPKV